MARGAAVANGRHTYRSGRLNTPQLLWLRIRRSIWRRIPSALRGTRAARRYGRAVHATVRRNAVRQQYIGTFFLRNRPQLEQIRRLILPLPQGATLRLAVLGCSIGAEVYSVLWMIRRARSDLDVRTVAADISPQVLDVAQKAVYSNESSALVGESIFERLSETERREMFDWNGATATVKPHLREGISWRVADVSSPELPDALGPQDIVLASNFLCHISPQVAERCLRNIARLVRPGGHLLVVGVDVDVRQHVAQLLGWHPVVDLIREIHDGDPVLRRDWPIQWWGLEPLDDRRPDWQLRYAATFRLE